MTVAIFDLPEFHQFLNENADEFFGALAETDDNMEIFKNISIRALIELKWPLAKANLIKNLFIPYVVLLLVYLFYTGYLYEWSNIEKNLIDKNLACIAAAKPGVKCGTQIVVDWSWNSVGTMREGVKALLIALAYYFARNEYR